tara:strand:- start:229 stop:501 length:273 start_codon:yes stop_codon:yes gene_type:complete
VVVAEAERLLVLELLQLEDQVVVELDMILLHLLVLPEIHHQQLHLKELLVEVEHHNNLEEQVVAVVELQHQVDVLVVVVVVMVVLELQHL